MYAVERGMTTVTVGRGRWLQEIYARPLTVAGLSRFWLSDQGVDTFKRLVEIGFACCYPRTDHRATRVVKGTRGKDMWNILSSKDLQRSPPNA